MTAVAASGADVGEEPPDWFDRLAAALPDLEHRTGRLRPPEGVTSRESAVLMLFGPGSPPGNPDVLLTRRASTLRAHAGQVAFPGGRVDPTDAGPAAAALREAEEETGLDPAAVQVAGIGPALFVPPTGFLVHPVLAWWRRPVPVAAVDPAEVELVARVQLAELVDPANRFTVRHPSGYAGPGFDVRSPAGSLFVWGFTAGVLSGLLALAGWERPWDATVLRPLPGPPFPAPASGPATGAGTAREADQ